MSDLTKRFTPLQVSKITAAGFGSLYDFITYLPSDFYTIKPLENPFSADASTTYLYNARLDHIEHRKGKSHFLILSLSGNCSIKAYLFSVARFTLQELKVGQYYQFLVTNKKGLWTIEKFVSKKDDESDHYILGRAKMQSYIAPKYTKQSALTTGYFVQLHRKLQPQDYMLDLRGLVPENTIIPQLINLYQCHYPATIKDYEHTKRQWIAFNAFLSFSVNTFIQKQQKQLFAKGMVYDAKVYDNIIQHLPFELSATQQKSIHDILASLSLS